jgi:N-formylglutamate deformylase
MNKLPFLISVPHAGRKIPEEAVDICMLTAAEIINDSDEGADKIYNIRQLVKYFVTTDIARAIIDLNRAPDDIRTDGVIKTHTCHMIPVYRSYPDKATISALINRYYYPYHCRLTELAGLKPLLGIDCHTMFSIGPPSAKDSGKERPYVCISNGDGTCPGQWVEVMMECFKQEFDGNVKWNDPFTGGYITRFHSTEMPWVQIEISRGDFMSSAVKHQKVINTLIKFADSGF